MKIKALHAYWCLDTVVGSRGEIYRKLFTIFKTVVGIKWLCVKHSLSTQPGYGHRSVVSTLLNLLGRNLK